MISPYREETTLVSDRSSPDLNEVHDSDRRSWRPTVSNALCRGLSAGGMEGIVEAAHIRGAGQPECGPDHITNGIALTPTLHRLFDRHLFSLQYQGNELVIIPSIHLTPEMVQDPITGSRLSLRQGQRVRLPPDLASSPGRQFVDFHRRLLRC